MCFFYGLLAGDLIISLFLFMVLSGEYDNKAGIRSRNKLVFSRFFNRSRLLYI